MQHSLTRGRRRRDGTLPGCPSLCEAAAAYPGQRFPQNTAAALPPRSRASQTSPPPRPSPTHSRVSPSPLHQRCVLFEPRWLSGIQSTLPDRMEERVGAPARIDSQPCTTRLCAPRGCLLQLPTLSQQLAIGTRCPHIGRIPPMLPLPLPIRGAARYPQVTRICLHVSSSSSGSQSTRCQAGSPRRPVL